MGFWSIEYWDLIGLDKGIELIKNKGGDVPEWITEMSALGFDSFAKFENGSKNILIFKQKNMKFYLDLSHLLF